METLKIMSTVIFAWLAVVGACLGSFLNVVIYRLPAGQSIVRPASRCPRCGHAIRWYHNLPVIGWLILRGKCYDCHQPISPRYPLIEALVAAFFLAAALLIFKLPTGQTPRLMMRWQLWLSYAGMTGLFCALLAGVMIRYDKHRIPRGILAAVVLFAAALAAGVWLPF